MLTMAIRALGRIAPWTALQLRLRTPAGRRGWTRMVLNGPGGGDFAATAGRVPIIRHRLATPVAGVTLCGRLRRRPRPDEPAVHHIRAAAELRTLTSWACRRCRTLADELDAGVRDSIDRLFPDAPPGHHCLDELCDCGDLPAVGS